MDSMMNWEHFNLRAVGIINVRSYITWKIPARQPTVDSKSQIIATRSILPIYKFFTIVIVSRISLCHNFDFWYLEIVVP